MIKIRNVIFFATFALAALLAFLMIKPFINVILTALVFVYLFYPLYNWINRRIRHEAIASFIVIFLILFLVSVPLVFVLNSLTRDVFTSYMVVKQKLAAVQTDEHFAKLYSNPEVRAFINNSINSISNFIISKTSNFLIVLSQKLLYVFILFFLIYYFLKDSKKAVKILSQFNFKLNRVNRPMVDKLKDMVHAVVYGTIVIAIVQGVLAGIGFYFLGVNSAVLFGVLTVICALIPFLGPTAVWLPLSAIMTISGYLQSSDWGITSGIILFLYGLLVINTVDNILKPKIIGSRANVHPALVLIGVVGGVKVFGMVGVVVGPVLFAMLITFFEVYIKERLTWN